MNDTIQQGSHGPQSDGHDLAILGPKLLTRLAALLRTARTHDVTNQAFQRQLKECLAVIEDEADRHGFV